MIHNIPKEKVIQRLRFENPWWEPPHQIDGFYHGMRHRAYFELFAPLARKTEPNRAVVLMGPRRVGKTVLLYQMIQFLIDTRIDPRRVCYVSVEHPIYNGLGLEDLFACCREALGVADDRGFYVFFDEIQYLPNWEVHLKSLVDSFREVKWVVSGSAAAALRLRSLESGAGRFTEFLLPPLTFHEYLHLLGRTEELYPGLVTDNDNVTDPVAMQELNRAFVDYLNYGGYPEVIFSDTIRADPGRYIRNDIIDKVLLRDLPSLYGIHDVQELNRLFLALAYNSAGEVSLEALSRRSGVAKNTIKRYIEYLEAAFLLRRVDRIDRDGRRFQRATVFKVYLTNPSIRSALFSPLTAEDPEMGGLVETAIFSQWFHSPGRLYYSRWNAGEVDLVSLGPDHRPRWALEAKWSDRYGEHAGELEGLIQFCRENGLTRAQVTTRTERSQRMIGGVRVDFLPASVYCYRVGRLSVIERAGNEA